MTTSHSRFLGALLFATIFALPAAGQPRRIVSTSPAITETLFAMGLGSRVVGVSTYCHFPAEVDKLPKVGTYLEPNIEVIARLKPDLAIIETLPNSARRQLQGLSIPIAEVVSGDVGRNLDAMVVIGKAAGAESAARALINQIEQKLRALKDKASGTPRSVAFVVGRTPGGLDDLFVVGGGSYLSELMETAGGRNVFADAKQAYVKTSLESLLRRDPDVLIDMGEMGSTVGVTEKDKQAVVKLWGMRPNLKAVRERRVYAVASDIFVVPGPRMVDAAQAFAEMLYPERKRQ